MKKVIFILIALLCVMGVSAQVDSTAVTTVTNIGISALFGVIGKFILNHAVWFTLGVAIISEILGQIKSIPQNNILQILWWILKAFLNAVAKLLGNSKNQ